MRILPFAPAVVVIVAVLIRPGLLPYAVAGLAVPLAVWAWERRRRARRKADPLTALRAPRRRVLLAALGGLVAMLTATAILLGGEDQPAHLPSPAPEPGRSLRLDGNYLARLRIAHDRGLLIDERVTIPAASVDVLPDTRRNRRALAALSRGLSRRGWEVESLTGTGRRYRRALARKLEVSGFLPAERTNRFAPPSSIRVRLGRHDRVAVLLRGSSQVVLDGPRNAIGDTFPAGERQRGPGGGERIALEADEFGDPVEFEVRSRPFRSPLLVKAVDVTLWTPFGWILVITTSLISDRVREIIAALTKRLLDRVRRRRPRRPIGGGADRPIG